MQFSDTFLTFNLYNKNGYITKDHKYHIHQNPPNVLDVSGTSYTVDCSTTGPHYNPYNVSVVQPMYEQECKGDFMERCEVGDLNGKHGLYEVGRTRKQFIDTNLKLYGPQSIFGRSLVVHGEEKQKTYIACSKLERFIY
uniref:Extracellular superoxide dismutase [Cu-Zn] (Trinotate prediction) n=1 Tax=Henneguya salminicola TaxID=69463 RepID=A0A6G3MK71_HENSL